MKNKAIQLPFSFIIFLIIIVIIIALLLIWNLSGIESFTNIFGSAGEVAENQSGGIISTLT